MLNDSDAAQLTVGQAAARLGVTVRTLHHWDEMGLAGPSSRSAAGYRLYAEGDLERLRRVAIYRELGLDLEGIRSILDDPSVAVVTTLRVQREQLAKKVEQLNSLGDDLARMADAHEYGLLMTAEEQTATFGQEWNPQWPAEARQRYGDTPEWRQYAERSASRTAADWQAVADAAAALDQALADAMDAGVEPGSPTADALVEQHRETFSAYFPITRQMQVVLGRMYEADPAYTAHYDGVRVGLTSWLRLIIDASARARHRPRHRHLAIGVAGRAAHGIKQKFIKPHGPWQDGKVDRLNRTLQTEWAYWQAFASNDDRAAALRPWIEHDNHIRHHSALGGKPLISRRPPN